MQSTSNIKTPADWREQRLLDCGHNSTPSDTSSGYAIEPDGSTCCYNCATMRERTAIESADRFGAYFTLGPFGQSGQIATWTGGKLATVEMVRECRHNIGGKLWRGRAVTANGRVFLFTSPGPGMYARLRFSARQTADRAKRNANH